ncbi:MAG: class I SAM-dependent RNA methyltransferase [Pseudomonadota bacterium]|nr:class I SAM-dependent RNA methyltransferase [Pseudomonadota bacterium]
MTETGSDTGRIEVSIGRLGHQGDGIAPGPVFVPRTLPGEVVSGVSSGDRLEDVRIVTPSAQRVAPPCRHYKACGGCQLQHASDGFVADWKRDIVAGALGAQDIETDVRPVSTSPAQSRRRATLAVRRTKKGALAGFHGRASDTITPIPDCLLLDSTLIQAIPMVEALAPVGGSRKGTLSVTLTRAETGLDVAVSGGKPLDRALERDLGAFAETHRLARLAWDGETVAMRELPTQRFGRALVAPPPGAFLQATDQGESDLLKGVRDIIGPAKRIADLFAGCGTFTLPLAETAEVLAVEGEADMIAALDRGWREAPGLKKVTAVARDLFRRPLMPDELAKLDAVVIDPPRAGAEAQIREIAASNVPVVAYVSCNPVTFARDARILCDAGFRLDHVNVVDQFRWSVHTELVASFRRG